MIGERQERYDIKRIVLLHTVILYLKVGLKKHIRTVPFYTGQIRPLDRTGIKGVPLTLDSRKLGGYYIPLSNVKAAPN